MRNEQDSPISFYMNTNEVKHFEKLFIEFAGNEDETILYENLKEILVTNSKLTRSQLNGCLDKIKKEIKLNMTSENDGDLTISNFNNNNTNNIYSP